jgi:Protein of unknown function (DUF2752)
VFVTLVGAVLHFFPPARYDIYPKCPVYACFHVLCPGCGATRALAALLGGRIYEAVHWNPLLIACMPFLLLFLCRCYVRAVRAKQFEFPCVPQGGLSVCLVATAAFTVVRNLSVF